MRQKTKFFYPNYKFQKKHFSHKWHPSKLQKINALIVLIDITSQQSRRKFIIVTPPYAAIVIKWPFQKKRRNLKIRERELSYLTWINNIFMNIQFIKNKFWRKTTLLFLFIWSDEIFALPSSVASLFQLRIENLFLMKIYCRFNLNLLFVELLLRADFGFWMFNESPFLLMVLMVNLNCDPNFLWFCN